MSKDNFELYWANPDDEPEIRSFVGSVPMPGAIAVRFAREPDYFLGATIMGDPCDILVVRRVSDGRLVGLGCRAERHAFVNGRESRLGYIGQIRVAAECRGHWLVQRGAACFKAASPPDLLYVGVIAGDNARARNLLVGIRPPGGLHTAHMGGFTTYALLLHRWCAARASGVDVAPGTPQALEEIVEFLRRHGARRQFFPAYTLGDFTDGRRMRGLRPQDVMVARRSGEVAGVMAVWDQAAYKQDIVGGYGPSLRRLRHLYDIGARLVGARPLTPIGEAISFAFAVCVCVANDDLVVMRALLAASMAAARARGKAYLLIGLADSDPLLTVVRRSLHVAYRSNLFAVSWSSPPVEVLDGRVPYIEIATL